MVQTLTPATAHELLDEIVGAYTSVDFQQELRELRELHTVWGAEKETRASEIHQLSARYQYPILERYGFEASDEGQTEMTISCSLVDDAEVAWKLRMVKGMAGTDQQAFEPSPLERKVRIQLDVRYQRDGFVCPLRALTPYHCADVLAGFKRFREQHIQRLPACGAHTMNHAWLPWLRELARHPSITSAVAVALDSIDLYLWDSELVVRSPGLSQMTATGVGWCRDQQHTLRLKPLDRNHFVTVFVALTPCSRRHGCLLAKPSGMNVEVPLELLPGQFALIAPSTKRMGGMNEASTPTWGVFLRYMRASMNDLDAPAHGQTAALLVLGEDKKNNFLEMPALDGEATDEGLELRKVLLERRQPTGIPKRANWEWNDDSGY